jgi:hypothetical protein
MKRKVIQISTALDTVGKYFIIALCNDGTLWKLHGLYEGDPKWEPFVAPPQKGAKGD